MDDQNLAIEMLNSFKTLNGNQKSEVITYINSIKKELHSTKRYRRRAMKQIREALLQE